MTTKTTTNAALVWERGPANDGGGTAGGDLWWDGDLLLVIVETNSGTEISLVSVHADVDQLMFTLANEDEVWGWGGDDISWWAKLEDCHFPKETKNDQ